jgi:hypothetical protein
MSVMGIGGRRHRRRRRAAERKRIWSEHQQIERGGVVRLYPWERGLLLPFLKPSARNVESWAAKCR